MPRFFRVTPVELLPPAPKKQNNDMTILKKQLYFFGVSVFFFFRNRRIKHLYERYRVGESYPRMDNFGSDVSGRSGGHSRGIKRPTCIAPPL